MNLNIRITVSQWDIDGEAHIHVEAPAEHLASIVNGRVVELAIGAAVAEARAKLAAMEETEAA